MTGSRRKVLLVDDDPDTADTLGLLLASDSVECRSAYSGEQALATARSWQPELVVLDLSMPVVDGIEVARRLLQDAGRHGTGPCLVAHTSMAVEPELKDELLALGFKDVMLKPAPISEWLALVRTHLDEDMLPPWQGPQDSRIHARTRVCGQ